MDVSDTSEQAGAAAPIRRTVTAACAAAGLAAMVLLLAGAYGVIYLALGGEQPSAQWVLHRLPHLVCVLLGACSA